MSTNKQKRANLDKHLLSLKSELRDYVKAKRAEYRNKPVYLKKDSDICVDRLREAFNIFIVETYRD
jgi:hypothetical protein